jgi:hypothetical protein
VTLEADSVFEPQLRAKNAELNTPARSAGFALASWDAARGNRQSTRPQCTAVQNRSTAVRTAYHVQDAPGGDHGLALSALRFVVGAIVGLTGMGGGSLMTPLLILLFGVHPLTAVGTDLLYAAVTKTAGTAIHSKKGNVDWGVAGLLAAGSVPATVLTI